MNGEKPVRDWIEDLGIQRKTLFSNGILVETDDSRRVSELIEKKPAIARIKTGEERWFILDGWEGFSEYKKTDKGNIEKVGVKGGNVQQFGFRQVLPNVSKELYKPNTVLLITNVFKTDDIFNNALRGWSTSDELREIDSTVIVFADDRSIFPTAVWSHMKIVKPPKSTWGERKKIISMQEKVLKPGNKLNGKGLEDAVRLTAGMNLDQLEAAAIESIILKDGISLNVVSDSKINILAKDPVVDIIQRPKFGFEAVGGYDSLKQRIIDDVVLPLKNPEMAVRYNMKPPRGLLLYGPPGTGKTLLVKSMAKELNMSILRIMPENILGKYVGESEKSLRRAFDIADAMKPVIVFIDELDRFSKRGEGDTTSSHVERELFSMLLEKLGDENREWFFAAATNMIECIDPALRRTGRIDSVAPVPFPDEQARAEIFSIHINVKRKLPLKDDIDPGVIAKHTYMWSGSDIEQLVIRTASHVMKEDIKDVKRELCIGMDDFLTMIDTFNISVEDNTSLQNQVKEQAIRFTNDTRLMDIFEHAEKTKTTGRTGKASELLKAKRDKKE